MTKLKTTKQVNETKTLAKSSNETLLKVTKNANETKLVGCSSGADFISRIKGLCFPICFPACFQKNVGVGKIKKLNATKLVSEQSNE